MPGINILGVGDATAPYYMSAEDIETTYDLKRSEEEAISKIGIKGVWSHLTVDARCEEGSEDPNVRHRLIQENGITILDTAAKAVDMCLARATEFLGKKVSPEDIGMVVCNTDTPDQYIPSTAAQLAKHIGCKEGKTEVAFDFNSACSSGLAHLWMCHHMSFSPENPLPKYVLLVCTSDYTRHTNNGHVGDLGSFTKDDDSLSSWDDYIWSSGASAVLISTEVEGLMTYVPERPNANVEDADKIIINRLGFFWQLVQAVRNYAVSVSQNDFRNLHKKYGTAATAYTVMHQASRGIQKKAMSELTEFDIDRHLYNVDVEGNKAASGCLTVISQNLHRFKKGDHIYASVFGSGTQSHSGCFIVNCDLDQLFAN